MIRFRLGNEMKESTYWEEEEKKMCRLCEGEIETWEHAWERCREWKNGGGGWQEVIEGVLKREGEWRIVNEGDGRREGTRREKR